MNLRKIIALCIILLQAGSPAMADEGGQKAVSAPAGQAVQTVAAQTASGSNAEQTLRNLIGMLVQKGILTKEAADQLLNAAAQPSNSPTKALSASSTTPPQADVLHVQYVPQLVKDEIKDEIKTEVLAQAKGERWGDPGTLPDWVNRLTFDGDFHVRFQHNGFPSSNIDPYNYNYPGLTEISNTTVDHNYWLLAGLFGVKAKLNDSTITVFRLTTGNTANPDSSNQTLGGGNGGYYAANPGVGINGDFNKFSVVLDRAYIESNPYRWLTLSGGKIPNPWLSTDIVYDRDVNFDGGMVSFKPQFNDAWGAFLTAGAFPVQDVVRSATNFASSKTLYAAQVGTGWMATDASTAEIGLAYYDFNHIAGTQNTALGSHFYDATAVSTVQKGNTLMNVNYPGDPYLWGLASNFRELDLTGKIDIATFYPTHVVLTGDYVKNIGFDRAAVIQRASQSQGIYAGNTAYQVNLTVGVPEIHEKGEWRALVAYKYIESDAVLDALNDQDFNLGGTNAKGYVIQGDYGLGKDAWVMLRWISTDQVSGTPLAIDVLQLDVNTRF